MGNWNPGDINPNTSHHGTGPDAHIIFSNIDTLLDTVAQVEALHQDTLTVVGVSPLQFARIEKARRDYGLSFRLFYVANEGELLVTVPTKLHEAASVAIHRAVEDRMEALDLTKFWKFIGTMTLRSNWQDSSSRQADGGGHPLPRSVNWPTLAITVGTTQALPDLQKHVGWWFKHSDHLVEMVLLVKVYESLRQIRVEKWMEDKFGPTLCQTSTIDMTTKAYLAEPGSDLLKDPASYIVNGDIVLEYAKLFPGRVKEGELDVLLTKNVLRQLGSEIWGQL